MTAMEVRHNSGRIKQVFMRHDLLTAVIVVIVIMWWMIPSSLVKFTDVSV